MIKTSEFHIAHDGDDHASGTLAAPFRSLERARAAVRELKANRGGRLPKGGVTVWVGGGRYELAEPFVLGPEDSGTAGAPVIYRAVTGERPVLSGGRRITGWRKAPDDLPGLPAAARGKVWVADVPEAQDGQWPFRQLWKDGERLTRARWPKEGTAPFRVLDACFPSPDVLRGFNQECKHSWREAGALSSLPFCASPAVNRWREELRRSWRTLDFGAHEGAFAGGSLPADLARGDAELVCRNAGRWAMIRVPVARAEGMRLCLAQPAGYLSYYWGGMRLMCAPEGIGWIENALSLLDRPGEWYLDRQAGRLHYLPPDGEDPNACEIVAPRLEQLIALNGAPDNPVRHIEVRGLAFQHAEWTPPTFGYRPFLGGCHGTEATPILSNPPEPPGSARAADEFPEYNLPAAVDLVHVERCLLEDCRVGGVGATGIGLGEGCRENRVLGCEVFDAGGNGIHVGLAHGPVCGEDFAWPRAADEPRDNEVAHCHVHHAAEMDWGAYGILNSYADRTRIAHNLVEQLPYSGIAACFSAYVFPTGRDYAVAVERNHIHHVMQRLFDGGAIYTKDAVASTSALVGNRIHDVGAGDHMVHGIFLDDGSGGFRIADNVIYHVAIPIRFNRCRPPAFAWGANYFGAEGEAIQCIGDRQVPIALEPPPSSAAAAPRELLDQVGPGKEQP